MDSSGYTQGNIRAAGNYFLTEETIRRIDEFSNQDKPMVHQRFWEPGYVQSRQRRLGAVELLKTIVFPIK